mmetsp:Transcript_24861/g.41158  ORF Transcript_24861/g.41158 Transcript_24861/m.41158 type:complete len:258 (-) Transcript_24861:403-1176(-)
MMKCAFLTWISVGACKVNGNAHIELTTTIDIIDKVWISRRFFDCYQFNLLFWLSFYLFFRLFFFFWFLLHFFFFGLLYYASHLCSTNEQCASWLSALFVFHKESIVHTDRVQVSICSWSDTIEQLLDGNLYGSHKIMATIRIVIKDGNTNRFIHITSTKCHQIKETLRPNGREIILGKVGSVHGIPKEPPATGQLPFPLQFKQRVRLVDETTTFRVGHLDATQSHAQFADAFDLTLDVGHNYSTLLDCLGLDATLGT